jgi:hypothetical protein
VLQIPPYLVTSNVAAGAPLSYAWDEWEIKKYYWAVDKQLLGRLDALTNDANLSLTNALGEWICYRFSPFDPDPVPGQYFEAAWAATVHPAYCVYTETLDDQWRGPVRGPLAMAITIANDAIFCLRDDPRVAVRACWMFNLARHVLPDSKDLDAWFGSCVARLERYHSKVSEQRPSVSGLFDEFPGFGRPVPREAFDPGRAYDPTEIPLLLEAFLRSLSPAGNSFLRPASQLDPGADLPGAPYRYPTSPPA